MNKQIQNVRLKALELLLSAMELSINRRARTFGKKGTRSARTKQSRTIERDL
jgi:hypothetical protein